MVFELRTFCFFRLCVNHLTEKLISKMLFNHRRRLSGQKSRHDTQRISRSKRNVRPSLLLLVVTSILTLGFIFNWIEFNQFPTSTSTTSSFTEDNEIPMNRNPSLPESTFEQAWPKIQSKLCPKPLQPNFKLAKSILFPLAAKQIGLEDSNTTSSILSNNNKKGNERGYDLASNFYSGTFASNVVVYAPTSSNNETSTTRTIIYVPIWKCANDQIRHYLESTYTSKSRMTAQEQRLASTNPCVITAIRDPISHFLSGYNEMEYRIIMANRDKYNKQDRNVHYNAPYQLNYNLGTTKRFEQFVKDLLNKQYGATYLRHWFTTHSYSMSRILSYYVQRQQYQQKKHPPKKLSLLAQAQTEENNNDERPFITSYLPSIENLTSTFPPFLQATCGVVGDGGAETGGGGSLKGGGEMSLGGQHNSSNDEFGTYHAAKQVWKQQGPIARALCILHIVDYACWTELAAIPNLCQDVYSDHFFSQSILNHNEHEIKKSTNK